MISELATGGVKGLYESGGVANKEGIASSSGQHAGYG